MRILIINDDDYDDYDYDNDDGASVGWLLRRPGVGRGPGAVSGVSLPGQPSKRTQLRRDMLPGRPDHAGEG